MKNKFYLLLGFGTIIVISLILSLQGCKKDNELPTCTITSPLNGASVSKGAIVTISVGAEDSDGEITEVRFFIDGVGMSTASSFPYNFEWNTTNVSVGNHTIKATAYDDEGATQSSDISVSIIANSGNNTPVAAFTASSTSINTGQSVSFTDQSTNTPTAWLWNFGDAGTSTLQNPSHTYSSAGTYTVSLTATNTYGSDIETKTNYITVSSGSTVSNVTNPTTGKIWMDRNLGASQVATSSTDAAAYGDLYQWGRAADGHQSRISGTTTTLSSSNTPGHSNFIKASSTPYDWRSPQNTNLWQGVNGVNNPCPSAYRLPTEAELNAERLSWSSNNKAGAFASPLKLPVAGYRNYSDGSLGLVGSYGYYWSSTLSGAYSRRLFFGSSGASMNLNYRAYGCSVRCLKD